LRTLRLDVAAPATAAILIALQVGSNAGRDGLLLSAYPVTAFPYFVAGASLVAIPAAQASGRCLTRYGPAQMAPVLLATSAVLFMVEWALLGWPRVASVLLYVHSSVLGAIAISAFWSLMNERFDPHSAKALIAKTAGAATLGGLLGGIGAERVAAMLPQGALLLVLAALGLLATSGVMAIARGAGGAVRSDAASEEAPKAWAELRRIPLLRDLALVTVLSAVVASLADYFLKAEAVAWLGKGEPLVRFFGIYYAATGASAFLLQAVLGRFALARLGLGGSVASHPVIVGTAGLLGFIVPAPWRGIVPRGLDVTVRNSVVRAGYELLYTPLPPWAKRSAKSLIDVTGDSVGKAAGAGLVLLMAGLGPVHSLMAVNIAIVVASAAEFVVARRLRSGYVAELKGGLRRHDTDVEDAAQRSLSDFTMMRSFAGLDASVLQQAIAEPAPDPVTAAYAALRSGNSARIRAALTTLPRDPALIGALVPLLANRQMLRQTVAALASFGPRAAGEMASALLDSDTPEVVRRRLPMALEFCDSPLARDGLTAALAAEPLEVRARAARALLALTERYPALAVFPAAAIAAAERQLRDGENSRQERDFVFNLLALAFEREPMQIAARAFDSTDPWVRGTSLEYLETVLPPGLWAALRPSFAAPAPRAQPRTASVVRADLYKAGATMTMSLDEVRRQLEALNKDEPGETE
jgi:prepilin signal peptidase PulO-like enzyme (type II secretory pathway)